MLQTIRVLPEVIRTTLTNQDSLSVVVLKITTVMIGNFLRDQEEPTVVFFGVFDRLYQDNLFDRPPNYIQRVILQGGSAMNIPEPDFLALRERVKTAVGDEIEHLQGFRPIVNFDDELDPVELTLFRLKFMTLEDMERLGYPIDFGDYSREELIAMGFPPPPPPPPRCPPPV